ncbi:unnamed protein product [Rhizoctonia solani]|uniref:Enoyl reductase (ER) domain-containing protein n=1 Tax=Rhizoctonia solani TaxID=456999 RepID=A0A8H3CP97_9AGAM|nr:unnamed protein product [Rhizoctonia solani]
MHVPKAGPGRVIVRVAASTMNSLDHKILTYGILAQEWPWVGGNEYAGTVVSVGPAVENLVVGDRVVAVAVNFVEGQEVSGWQEYALLSADLCTKLPDDVPFDKACTVPTAFTSASIAIALELGLKYPDPPPAPPKKSAASIWEDAMAALGNGATFGWDLEGGTIQGGVWLPKPKVSAIQGAPLSPEAAAKKAEAERLRREEEERQAKARREHDEHVRATLTQALAEQIEKRRTQGPQPSAPRVPGYGTYPRRAQHFGTDPDPWARAHPMSGAFDMTREATDRRWGPDWEDNQASRRFEVVDERHNALGLHLTTGLGLGLGPKFDATEPIPRGLVGVDCASTNGSTSASASMGRGGSDDSSASTSASSAAGMSASYPSLPTPNVGPVGRRGSEPSLRAQESLSTWMGVGSVPGPGPIATLHHSSLAPARLTNLGPRSRSSGTAPSKLARSSTPSSRGTTSPFRVATTLPGRGRGRGSPPYRVREQSPLGRRPSSSLETSVKIESTFDRPDPSQFAIAGATALISPSHPTFSTTFPDPSSEMMSKPDSWSLSAGGGVPNTFFPPPLTRTENPVYVMNEPILIWGGATCAGRAALQLLKRAGYTNLFVVAAYERHPELAEIAPANTKFFDYRDPNVVDEIRTTIGAQKLNKVLDTISMPHTLEPISQLVTSGAKIATFLPANTPMPDGVEVKPVMFGRCHDYTGKDVLSFNFGKETMWPLLGDLLRKEEWVYPPAVHLTGGLQACATDAMRMMSSRGYAGKRLVFEVSNN